MIGNLYKNRSRYPERVFLVTKVTRVKKGILKTHRISGLQITAGGISEESYLSESFNREFPFLMWGPANEPD